MEKYILSTDQVNIHFTETGNGDTALVFVHGWLGNGDWWNSQEAFFGHRYKIVKIDLGGHGRSDRTRQNWTGGQYAQDITTVVDQIGSSNIILVGHSMSGAYVLEAANSLPNVKAIILVDTLKDLDQNLTPAQAEVLMFSHYRRDFRSAVEQLLPQFLFVQQTPKHICEQLQQQFLQYDAQHAINALQPLYEMDLRKIAARTAVPVRAVNSDAQPTAIDNNRKYFPDYDYRVITGTGHYPMLERPEEFSKILDEILEQLTAETQMPCRQT
jgi:pimeloyl-ACP methyl ester carboxylesterase